MGQQERLVLNVGFLFRSNLARRKTWCDADSSSFLKIEAKGKIEFERGGAEEKNFTRLQMAKFLAFLVNLGNVDESVQCDDGVSIDAKAINDSMYGASGRLAMEEKRTAIEMMGIQEGMKRQNAILPRIHGEANLNQGKRRKRSWNASMAIDVSQVLSKKW